MLATIAAPPHQKFAAADVSPDGRWLVGRFENSSLVYHGRSKNEEEWKACLYSNRVARVWNLETGEEFHVLRGHTDRVTAARFSPDGQRIVTSSSDNTLRVWDTVSGAELKTIAPKANAIDDVYFTSAGEILAILPGAIYETQYVDDGEHGDSIDELDPPCDLHRPVTQIRDGQRGYRQMKVSLQSPIEVPLLDQLPFSGTGQAAIRLWDGGSFEEIPLVLESDPNRDPPDFSCVQYVSDIATLLLGTTDGDIIVLSVDERKQEVRLETELKSITSIQICPAPAKIACR